jgi:hypothetical protein
LVNHPIVYGESRRNVSNVHYSTKDLEGGHYLSLAFGRDREDLSPTVSLPEQFSTLPVRDSIVGSNPVPDGITQTTGNEIAP